MGEELARGLRGIWALFSYNLAFFNLLYPFFLDTALDLNQEIKQFYKLMGGGSVEECSNVPKFAY